MDGVQRCRDIAEVWWRKAWLRGRCGRDGVEEVTNRHLEGASDANEQVCAGLGVAALDATEMLRVDSRQLRQLFLGEILLDPEPVNLIA